MQGNIKQVLPINIQKYIKIQVIRLMRTTYFSYHDREDLEQELWLFYFQKLKAFQNPRVNEGFFFIAIRNKALEILRTKRRQVHYSQQYINEELGTSFETNPIKNTEDQEVVSKMLKNLTSKE